MSFASNWRWARRHVCRQKSIFCFVLSFPVPGKGSDCDDNDCDDGNHDDCNDDTDNNDEAYDNDDEYNDVGTDDNDEAYEDDDYNDIDTDDDDDNSNVVVDVNSDFETGIQGADQTRAKGKQKRLQ